MLWIPKRGEQKIIPFLNRMPAFTIVVTMKIEEVNGALEDIDPGMYTLAGERSICDLALLPPNQIISCVVDQKRRRAVAAS